MRAKIIVPVLFLAIIIGVFIGQSVFAGGAVPGSQADPLVTKAFVESALNSQLTQLQQQVAQLQSEANSLRQQVTFLESKIGAKAPEQPPITNNSQQQPGTQIVSQPQPEDNQQPTVSPQPKQKVAYVKQSNASDVVNTRSGAGTNFGIVAKVSKGSKMIILDEKDDWYRVKLEDGNLAWVANWVVDVTEE
ncbi:MAG: hypothetical protein JM58_17160 [Peptococcaceae bacterium BICA1-8]|nr:MAG: hypothetical protein JM58_17160 [Peptococcaceae bacterium BICA1-8]